MDRGAQIRVGIGVAGALVLLFLAGLGWAIVFALLYAAWLLSRRSLPAGLALGLVTLVAFFGPGLLDQAVMDRQMTALEAAERTPEPLDLRGQRVMFVGASGRYSPVDCSDLCRSIAAYGQAEAVYFGYNRSLDLIITGRPAHLLGRLSRDIRTFDDPPRPGEDSSAEPRPVTPEAIDLVIFELPIVEPEARPDILPDVPSFAGLFRMTDLHAEFLVYAVEDPTAFDATAEVPLISRFQVSRNRASLPDIPFFPTGPLRFEQRYAADQTQRVTANAREVVALLCGPETNPSYEACRLILE